MAVKVPIWPGSASFSDVSGNTPFGLYDSDVVYVTASVNTADWCAKRLGYPLTDIELQNLNFFACFEEAVTEYGAQVNTFNIRDNLLNLYGAETGSNLTGQKVSANFGGIIELAEDYGTEAGSGGNVTYYTGSLSVETNKQIYDLTDSSVVSLESGTPGTDAIEIKQLKIIVTVHLIQMMKLVLRHFGKIKQSSGIQQMRLLNNLDVQIVEHLIKRKQR